MKYLIYFDAFNGTKLRSYDGDKNYMGQITMVATKKQLLQNWVGFKEKNETSHHCHNNILMPLCPQTETGEVALQSGSVIPNKTN